MPNRLLTPDEAAREMLAEAKGLLEEIGDELAEVVREKRRELDEAEHRLQWASRQMMDAWRRMNEEAAAETVSAGQEGKP